MAGWLHPVVWKYYNIAYPARAHSGKAASILGSGLGRWLQGGWPWSFSVAGGVGGLDRMTWFSARGLGHWRVAPGCLVPYVGMLAGPAGHLGSAGAYLHADRRLGFPVI